MSNSTESLAFYDIAFMFRRDNPFRDDPSRKRLNELKTYIEEHHDQFTEIDYIVDSRYVSVIDDVEELFGKEVTDTDLSDNPITSYIKQFISNIDGLSDELREWANTGDLPPMDTITGGAISGLTGLPDTPFDDLSGDPGLGSLGNAPFIPILPRKFTTPSGVATNYDISSDKTITFEELRKLTVNIARSKLVPDIVKDETVIALESEKRKQLIQEITRYRNVRVIAALDDSDLSAMTLPQLEQCLEKCKAYHENFKVQEMCKRGLTTGSVLYDVAFPEGIPIRNKRIQFNGVGKEILSTLFDPRTPVGLSFSNLLNKHNIHISDEVLIITAFLGVCVSKVKIVDAKPKEEPKSVEKEPIVISASTDDESADEYDDELVDVSE